MGQCRPAQLKISMTASMILSVRMRLASVGQCLSQAIWIFRSSCGWIPLSCSGDKGSQAGQRADTNRYYSCTDFQHQLEVNLLDPMWSVNNLRAFWELFTLYKFTKQQFKLVWCEGARFEKLLLVLKPVGTGLVENQSNFDFPIH
jgi:hypothetical protein